MKTLIGRIFGTGSKPQILGLGLLLLTASASNSQTYHQVAVSAVIYSPGGGANVITTVVNDTWLIERILNVSAKEASGYAVVLNDGTGSIDIYSKAGGFAENVAISLTGVTADLANSAGTRVYKTGTIEPFGNSDFVGSEISVATEDAHGDIVSDTITFNAGYAGSGITFAGGYSIGSPSAMKGTIVTTGVKYTQ